MCMSAALGKPNGCCLLGPCFTCIAVGCCRDVTLLAEKNAISKTYLELLVVRNYQTTLFFAVWDIFCSVPKNNAVSWLGFWLLGNACQPDLFSRFLGGR